MRADFPSPQTLAPTLENAALALITEDLFAGTMFAFYVFSPWK
jgi:hypothetical protein